MIIPRIGDRVEVITSFAGGTLSKGHGDIDIISEKNIIVYEEMIRKGLVKIIEFVERKENEKNENLNVLSDYRKTGRQDAAVDAESETGGTVRHTDSEGKSAPVRNWRGNAKRSTELRKDAPDSPKDGI
jgi:hypothetical protein